MLSLQAGDPMFEGYDVVYFIAGITSMGAQEDTYRIISHDIPVHFASIMSEKEKMTFIYLSGSGTKENGRQMWQKVKSSTERETQAMGFRHAYGWRPMMMTPYKGQHSHQVGAQKAAMVFYPLLRLFGAVCSMTEMVNAMVNVATNGFNRNNVEARDIVELGK